jgi:hypothetical protein
MLRTDEVATQREVVRLMLEHELVGLEQLLGSGAVATVTRLAADGVVIRRGERLRCSPAVSRLDDLGLAAPRCLSGEPRRRSNVKNLAD